MADPVREVQLPIKWALVNLTTKRQVQGAVMRSEAPDNGDRRTNDFHLGFLPLAVGNPCLRVGVLRRAVQNNIVKLVKVGGFGVTKLLAPGGCDAGHTPAAGFGAVEDGRIGNVLWRQIGEPFGQIVVV